VIPSGEVIASVEESLSAAKSPKLGDQATAYQAPPDGVVLEVQVVPSSEVITAVVEVPLEQTATNLFRVGE
jgi:hypothetical protein